MSIPIPITTSSPPSPPNSPVDDNTNSPSKSRPIKIDNKVIEVSKKSLSETEKMTFVEFLQTDKSDDELQFHMEEI